MTTRSICDVYIVKNGQLYEDTTEKPKTSTLPELLEIAKTNMNLAAERFLTCSSEVRVNFSRKLNSSQQEEFANAMINNYIWHNTKEREEPGSTGLDQDALDLERETVEYYRQHSSYYDKQ